MIAAAASFCLFNLSHLSVVSSTVAQRLLMSLAHSCSQHDQYGDWYLMSGLLGRGRAGVLVGWLVAWFSGRTLVFGWRAFAVLRSTCS